jgi:hypothetical protein
MTGPLPLPRNERPTAARGAPAASRGGTSSSSDLPAAQQSQIAALHQAFDFDAAERAEFAREHEILEALLMAFLKNEDEITKKWISLI